MADFETKLLWLSERGNPVGAEELIERIEAEMAGDPLVVVSKRREGKPMTKTQQPPTIKPRNRYRRPSLGVAAFAIILAVVGIYYFAFLGVDNNVADTQPVPPQETMTDREVIEAGVAAVYSGDTVRAAELFELEASSYPDQHPLSDQEIGAVATYQKAIGGRLTVDCTEGQTPGEFTCRVPYHNAMTDAIGFTDGGDTNRVVVKDGVITTFGFPEHSGMLVSMAAYLARELGGELPEECHHLFSPFSETCAAIQLENVDGWAAFHQTEWPGLERDLLSQIGNVWDSQACSQQSPAECDRAQYEVVTTWAADAPADANLEVIEAGVAAVYSGDADRAAELFELEDLADDAIREMAAYQKAIGGRLTMDCTELQTVGEFTCRVRYHNTLTDAIGFTDGGDTNTVVVDDGVITTFAFPEHTGMLVSVAAYFALESGIEVSEECFGLGPFPETCAAIQLGDVEGWAAFHETLWPELEPSLMSELEGAFYATEACDEPSAECRAAMFEIFRSWVLGQK